MKEEFYNCEHFLNNNKKYCTKIHEENVVSNKDLKYFQKLVEKCFSEHILLNPTGLRLEDIEPNSKKFGGFYNKEDLTNIFITEYYKVPMLQKLHRNDLSKDGDKITNEDDVLEEITDIVSEANQKVALIGDVGEGKSAFLSKLTLHLNNFESSEITYLPILIDIQDFDGIFDEKNIQEIILNFWGNVHDTIISVAEEKLHRIIPDEIQNTTDNKLSLKASIQASLTIFLAKIKSVATSKITISEKMVAKKTYSHLNKIKNAITVLNNEKIQVVLIFDNLDTLYYDHERYMLFKNGYDKLNTKINIVKNVIDEVTRTLNNSGASFIFTARPYVYNHVFNHNTQLARQNRKLTAVYKLLTISASTPLDTRLKMIIDLVKKLENHDFPKGKKEALENHLSNFQSIIKLCINHNDKPFQKLFALSNQGFRSMVRFYGELKYHPNLYFRYFNHDIVFLYKLSKRELYSQLFPNTCETVNNNYFPNMFLVNCDNYCNKDYEEACQPHNLTYWLKYLILLIVVIKKEISIHDILNLFVNHLKYEEHAVKLSIGSLATANEYNCLSLNFSSDSNGFESLPHITYLKPTSRGVYLINKNYCLDFECLQLFYDDWLLPKPHKNNINFTSNLINDFYMNNYNYTYKYILDGDNIEYQKNKDNILIIKAKQSLLLLYLLESSLKFELKNNNDKWMQISTILNNNIKIVNNDINDFYKIEENTITKKKEKIKINIEFLSKDYFTKLRSNIIDKVNIIMKNNNYDKELTTFNNELLNDINQINEFYLNIYASNYKVKCSSR